MDDTLAVLRHNPARAVIDGRVIRMSSGRTVESVRNERRLRRGTFAGEPA